MSGIGISDRVSKYRLLDFAVGWEKLPKREEVALADANATLSADDLINKGIFVIEPTSARTLTTDTAANIVAAIDNCQAGMSFDFALIVLAAYDVSVSGGTGVTVKGSGTVNNASGIFKAVITDCTSGSEAVTIYRIA